MSYQLKHHTKITKTPKHRADVDGPEPIVRLVYAAPSHAQPGNVLVALTAFPDGDNTVCESFDTYLTPETARSLAQALTAAADQLATTEFRDVA